MNRYLCKCGRAVNKSTNADNTGNRETEGCEGCPYLMPWGEQKYNHDTKHFYLDIKGYECRMSQTLEYETRFGGSVTDRCTCYIASLDFDFLERVSAWIKEHYPDGQISGTFSRETIRAVEYVSNGRYRLSISCAQNKAGIAAKAALFNAFFDESGRRFDMDADAEKAKILRDIERGKAAAHSVAAAPDKETKTMLIYRDPATGWLYRVSPQPENGIYAMQYRDPANSVVWKPDITWNTNAVYRDREHLQEGLEARAKRDGLELVSGPASSEPPEVVDEGEEYSPCDTCRCPDCIDSSCPQAGCDKTDGGFGCFAPYEECPAPAEKTWPDEHLVKDKISDWVGDVTDFLKDLFGIASPSKLMRDEVGVYLAQGIGVGFSNEIGGVKKMIEDSVPQEFDVDAKVNIGNEFKYDNDDKKPKPRGGGSAAGGVVVNQYIYANTTDYAKQQKEAARQFRMIARTV